MITLKCSSNLLRLFNVQKTGKVASIWTTSSCNAVLHVRNENIYFKEIYSDDLQFQRLKPIMKSKDIVEDQKIASFDQMVKTSEINNNKLIPFLKNFTDDLKGKNVESLIFVLNRLRESKFKHMSVSVHYLITYLDRRLTEYLEDQDTISNETFETLFQTALLFDEIGLQSWSKFIGRLASKPLSNIELFDNKENLLRLLYIWNLSRKRVESDKALLIELQIVKFFHCNQLSLRECGIICLGFHKTQTKFQTNLIEQIANKLANEIDSFDDIICLVSILKGIYSSDYKLNRDLMEKLKTKLMDNQKFSENFIALTKLLAIEKKYRHYDERLIQKTLDVLSVQETVRVKELSRLLLNLLFFDVQLNSKQIGKFNELFEHFKSNFIVYRIEYLLSVYALASNGLIRKEEIYNIFEPEFLQILRTKYSDISYFFIHLNNVLKLYGEKNYTDIALDDKELLRSFKSQNVMDKKEVYARFKKFEHYPSKLYLTYQTLKESLEGRVHLVQVLPGCKYPTIVITPEKTVLKDYPFAVGVNVAPNHIIVQLPSFEVYCDREAKRFTGFYKLEKDLLKKMGFKLIEVDNQRISHNSNELRLFLQKEVLDKIDVSQEKTTSPNENEANCNKM